MQPQEMYLSERRAAVVAADAGRPVGVAEKCQLRLVMLVVVEVVVVMLLTSAEVLRLLLRLWLTVAFLGSGRVVGALVRASNLVQPRGREVRVRPSRGLDVALVQELLLDVRDLPGLDWRRHQRVVRIHLVVVSWILELRLERWQPLVDEVRLVVALQVVRLVVGGVLVLHRRRVVAGSDVRPRQKTGGRRRRRQNIGRAPAHGRQGQERRAGGRNVDLPRSVAALV